MSRVRAVSPVKTSNFWKLITGRFVHICSSESDDDPNYYQNIQFFTLVIELVGLHTKDDYLEIKLNDRNQVDDKIAWGLGGGFLSL